MKPRRHSLLSLSLLTEAGWSVRAAMVLVTGLIIFKFKFSTGSNSEESDRALKRAVLLNGENPPSVRSPALVDSKKAIPPPGLAEALEREAVARNEFQSRLRKQVESFTREEEMHLLEKSAGDASLLAGLSLFAPKIIEKHLLMPGVLGKLSKTDLAVLLSRDKLSDDARSALLNAWTTRFPEDNVAKMAATMASVLTGAKPASGGSIVISKEEFQAYNGASENALMKVYDELQRPKDLARSMALLHSDLNDSTFGMQIRKIQERLTGNDSDHKIVLDKDSAAAIQSLVANLSASASLNHLDYDRVVSIQAALDAYALAQGEMTTEEASRNRNELLRFKQEAMKLGALPEMRSLLTGQEGEAFDLMLYAGPDGGTQAANWFHTNKPQLYEQLTTIPVDYLAPYVERPQ